LSAGALLLLLVRIALLFRANAELLQARADEARRDPLTGIGNRRALLEALETTTRPHRLALYDLDGFKAYNDAFGHPAGDALLRRLAE
ncbi:diguanylate cyclase domain-containing protein, partial [Desulfocurvus sp. DL9XJH121]